MQCGAMCVCINLLLSLNSRKVENTIQSISSGFLFIFPVFYFPLFTFITLQAISGEWEQNTNVSNVSFEFYMVFTHKTYEFGIRSVKITIRMKSTLDEAIRVIKVHAPTTSKMDKWKTFCSCCC